MKSLWKPFVNSKYRLHKISRDRPRTSYAVSEFTPYSPQHWVSEAPPLLVWPCKILQYLWAAGFQRLSPTTCSLSHWAPFVLVTVNKLTLWPRPLLPEESQYYWTSQWNCGPSLCVVMEQNSPSRVLPYLVDPLQNRYVAKPLHPSWFSAVLSMRHGFSQALLSWTIPTTSCSSSASLDSNAKAEVQVKEIIVRNVHRER